jgi:drug/metabolite transporter (DMT)-like permease
VISLVAGFAGVAVLASGKAAGASIGWAVVAGSTAAFLYGIGANLVRRQLAGLPPAAVAAATLGTAALLALPFAIAQWPRHEIPARSWFSAAMIGVLCTGIAYAMFYRLIQRIGAGRAVTVTYLVPLFGVAWAWLLLDEPLTLSMGIAGVLILGSVALSQRAAR